MVASFVVKHGVENNEELAHPVQHYRQRGFQQPLPRNRGPSHFTVHLCEQRRELVERHLGQRLDRPDRMVGLFALLRVYHA